MIKMQIIVLKFALFDLHFYDQFVNALRSPLYEGKPIAYYLNYALAWSSFILGRNLSWVNLATYIQGYQPPTSLNIRLI